MSVKKLSFYLDSAQITLRSNHLPLKKFLEKNTMNAKVNNWAVELESQNINFEFIAGTKNVLADTLSRLIELDESIKLPTGRTWVRVWVHPLQGIASSKSNSNRGSHHK